MLQSPDATYASDNSTVLDATTRLVPDPVRPGQFSIDLDSAWSSLIGMHGGYLVAVAIAAAQRVVGDRPIRTVTTSFLRPAFAKPATVSVDVVRAGRSITNLAVTLTQSADQSRHCCRGRRKHCVGHSDRTRSATDRTMRAHRTTRRDRSLRPRRGDARSRRHQCRRHRPGEGTDH